MSKVLITILIILLILIVGRVLILHQVQDPNSGNLEYENQELKSSILEQSSKWKPDLNVDIEANDSEYAKGNIGSPSGGGGAKWFAVKRDKKWILLISGNGLESCKKIQDINKKYQLKEDFLPCSN